MTSTDLTTLQPFNKLRARAVRKKATTDWPFTDWRVFHEDEWNHEQPTMCVGLFSYYAVKNAETCPQHEVIDGYVVGFAENTILFVADSGATYTLKPRNVRALLSESG